MPAHAPKAAFFISIIILLSAAVYLLRMASPTGYAVSDVSNSIGNSGKGIGYTIKYALARTPCADTDGGQEPFVYGMVTMIDGETIIDHCLNENTVTESYCDKAKPLQVPISCPLGSACINGACEP